MSDGQHVSDLTVVAELRAILVQKAADDAQAAAAELDERIEALRLADELGEAAASVWSAHLTSSFFDPGFGLMLAADLLAKDARVQEMRREHQRSVAASAACEEQWQRALAEDEAGKTLLQGARKVRERRREELRLGEMADRVTLRWGAR
ncbi:hypothetical protein AQZ52_17500 [Novosphingobium fuchskuhlense]|uniref:Flagellar FliJ protein n=1 Tax=Novosphingobium fuchskuhlense TaxID=1117702 RepID=A0A117US96_9SPHN|nr:hypothetical protein [Novosphingobium fuchskuhlense]KUR69898.1 hypothetical protein AQZ52_17500 [Novosphingobium fuchskuhlense]